MVITLFIRDPLPAGIPAASQDFKPALLTPTIHHPTNHFPAHIGTKLFNLSDAERLCHAAQGMLHNLGFGATRTICPTDPVLKLSADFLENRQKVVHIRPGIMAACMPVVGTLRQGFVVSLLSGAWPSIIDCTRPCSTWIPSMRLEETALSIKACSRNAIHILDMLIDGSDILGK